MPAVKPDEIGEAEGQDVKGPIPDVTVDETEMEVTAAVEYLNEKANAAEERVDELEEKTRRQEAVIHELVEAVEMLGYAADWEKLEAASEARDEYGSDTYPWEWPQDVLELKSERYE